jgi:hypothetical protein
MASNSARVTQPSLWITSRMLGAVSTPTTADVEHVQARAHVRLNP